MLEKSYKAIATNKQKAYFFYSEGKNGRIPKVVLFQRKENRFNIVLADVSDGRINDKVATGNNDAKKVIATVIKCIYKFYESHPNAVLEIKPVDEKRKKFFNAILKRRHIEFEQSFQVFGIFEGRIEHYTPEKDFDSFEVILKNREEIS